MTNRGIQHPAASGGAKLNLVAVFAILALFASHSSAPARAATLLTLGAPAQHLSGVALSVAKPDTGIRIEGAGAGAGHSLHEVRVIGGDYGVWLRDTTGVLLVNLQIADPHGHGLYFSSTGGTSNRGTLVINPQITINRDKPGYHCVRIYGADGVTIIGGTLSHYGTYGGSTLNARQISNSRIYRLHTSGRPAGIGPDKSASEESYRCENVTFIGCTFDMNGGWLAESGAKDLSPFVVWSGCRNITFEGCTFIQRAPGKTAVRIEAAWKSRPAAQDIVFNGCKFYAPRLADGGNVAGATFINSTLNDQVIR